MADTRSLRFIGIIYGLLAVTIGLIAVIVVSSHLSGNLKLDEARGPATEISASRR
jgi:hypothetical protein